MINRTAPWDHKKRIVLKSGLVRLCAKCGGNTHLIPYTDNRECNDCGSPITVEVWEHEAREWREQIRQARQLADELQPQADELRRGLTAISYLRGDEPTERW